MKIYHLSHIDLDGYACQYIVNSYFKNCAFYNSNYGREINDNFYSIVNEIKLNWQEKSIILISDLNLTLQQCEEFSKLANERNIKLILLDHHQSGLECAQKYDWYFLDSSRCATKIVYDFLTRFCKKDEALERFVNVVNAIDIWLKDDENFELGKVFLGMIATAKEINRIMFAKQNNAYMFHLLDKARAFIGKNEANIALEDNLHLIKKDFFKKEKNDTLNNLISEFIVERLSQNKENLSIYCDSYKGLLTSNIGNTSVIGNDFLVKNPDFDFFVDISSKKTLSFRSNDKVDVSLLAKKLVGGGGHKNASGGLFASFKDSSDYNLIKAQFVDLIKSKELNK